MNGYTGKILRLNLTAGKISIINTEKYQQWGGGHGMGSAIFWDLVKNKAISGFDPANIVTIMTSPLSGTLVPGASARTEVQGIGVQSSPVEWFTRSNFGGRFAPMLKYAGWDGIVVEGKADKPVWIDIRNDKVRIKDAGHLWGLDTWQTQEKIWAEVMEGQAFGDWMKVGGKDSEARTTQKPAVLTIGPAGENLGRIACLIHDVANASGQGGFGGVWGSKNLKAISVIGTGSIKVSDPNALMESRIWAGIRFQRRSSTRQGKAAELFLEGRQKRPHSRMRGLPCRLPGKEFVRNGDRFDLRRNGFLHLGRQKETLEADECVLHRNGFATETGCQCLRSLARAALYFSAG
jgi:aldehyde:ferredoxin oxidoreductase